jgi:hypothetical protein
MRRNGRMIGYNRTVRLRWLDQVVDLILAGQDEEQIYCTLSDILREQLSISSTAKRGSREKTITLLIKTWLRVPAHLIAFRDEGLELFKSATKSDRLALHWGMTMAVYPFWRSVADATGRLFHLQGTASAGQVQRRMKEVYGEREVVSRSARYVLRAFADWGVIQDIKPKGTYVASELVSVDKPPLAAWLLEGAMYGGSKPSADWKTLLQSPALFPFHLQKVRSDLMTRSGRIEVVRQNVGDELLILRKQEHERTAETSGRNLAGRASYGRQKWLFN